MKYTIENHSDQDPTRNTINELAQGKLAKILILSTEYNNFHHFSLIAALILTVLIGCSTINKVFPDQSTRDSNIVYIISLGSMLLIPIIAFGYMIEKVVHKNRVYCPACKAPFNSESFPKITKNCKCHKCNHDLQSYSLQIPSTNE